MDKQGSIISIDLDNITFDNIFLAVTIDFFGNSHLTDYKPTDQPNVH